MTASEPVHVDLLSFTYQRQLRQASGDNRPLLEELCRYITPEHATKWKKIGTELGVAFGDLNVIEEMFPGLHEICCNEMFEKWLHNDSQATWNRVFTTVGIESWSQIPNYRPTASDSTDGLARRQSADFILGVIPRHCILHALTVIKEAQYKGNSSLLENFIKTLEAQVKRPSSTKSSRTGFTQLQPVPIIPPRSLKRFVDKALSTIEFARVIEMSLKEAADEKSNKLDLNGVQMVCWRYYVTEKKDSLPQCNWLNKTMMYQLFIIFNHYLGADNAMIITGIKMNQLLERLLSPLQDSEHLFVKNSPVATFDFIKYLAEIINCLGNSHLSDNKIARLIMELYDEKMNGIFKKGSLVKKGGRRKNWKKRWFILKEGALIYYESNENLVMKGMIVLNKSSDALSTPDEKNKLNRFVVMCGESGRGFEMKADTPLQKMEWLQAIKKVLENKNAKDEASSNNSEDSPATDSVYYSYIDSDEDTTATSPPSNKEQSDSDEDCYVLPSSPVQSSLPNVSITPPRLLPSQPIPKQSSQEEVDNYEETDTWDYDYPFLDERLLANLSPIKNQRMVTSRQKCAIKKSLSYNDKPKHASQATIIVHDPDDEYEELTSLKPLTPPFTRSISHGGISNQNDESDAYIRMNPGKQVKQPHYTNSIIKSHSLENNELGSIPSTRHEYVNVPKPAERPQHGIMNETSLTSNHQSSTPAAPNDNNTYYVNSDCGNSVYQNVDDDSDDGYYLELVSPFTAYGNAHGATSKGATSKSTKPVYNRRKKPQVTPKPAV